VGTLHDYVSGGNKLTICTMYVGREHMGVSNPFHLVSDKVTVYFLGPRYMAVNVWPTVCRQCLDSVINVDRQDPHPRTT